MPTILIGIRGCRKPQGGNEMQYETRIELTGMNAMVGTTFGGDDVLESYGQVTAAVIGNETLLVANNWNSSPSRIEHVRRFVRSYGLNTMPYETWQWLENATAEEMAEMFERAGMGTIESDPLHNMLDTRAAASAWEHDREEARKIAKATGVKGMLGINV
jgi:hypothetical protein